MDDLERRLAKAMDEAIMAAMLGPPRKQKQTALQLSPGGGFRVVELDDAGKVVEPPPPCCHSWGAMHAPNCKTWGSLT